MKESDKISEKFLSCLLSFMHGSGETSLECGYTIGREAIENGSGLLKIAETYVTALHEILAPLSPEAARIVTGTQEFLLTSLAPFEMTHRGYRESMGRLQKLNVTLEHQTQELVSVNRELEAFSSSVSHDLRAPLRSIDGFSQALLEDCGANLDEQGREHLRRIRANSQRMAQLIDDLLDLSRMTRCDIQREPIDLSTLTHAIVLELRDTAPARSVDVVIAPGSIATGDARLLRIVLENLIGNAWKFTRKRSHARIEFGVISGHGTPAYFVRDDGAGFDMAYAVKLFGAFQRLHDATEFEGTGIGLATVQRIIHKHGGRVWAESAVNQGATFYFTL